MCINRYLQKGNDTGQKKSGNEYRCTDCELFAGTAAIRLSSVTGWRYRAKEIG